MLEPKRDLQTINAAGENLSPLPHGVSFHEVRTQTDERGTVNEIFDLRWGWCSMPVQYAYCFTIRPGFIKGWGLHKKNEDRYFILFGEIDLYLYDERDDSPTRGLLSRISLSEHNRRLVNIPAGIWHLDKNIGTRDAVLISLPSQPYNHANPDKYRLPPNNDRIPIKFDHPQGG